MIIIDVILRHHMWMGLLITSLILEACMVASVTIEVRLHGGIIQVSSGSWASGSCF